MATVSSLIYVLPSEAYALGRTTIWAGLALAAGWYLRKEVRALLAAVATKIAELETFKAGGVEIGVKRLPVEEVMPVRQPVEKIRSFAEQDPANASSFDEPV